MKEDKKEFREKAREDLLSLSKAYRDHCHNKMTENLFSLPEYKASRAIFCYVGGKYEPDTGNIIKKALSEGRKVAFPVTYEKGIMEARQVLSISDLRPGRFGIPEPGPDAEVIAPGDIDLVIVPAAAFDEEGYRVGKGGGYYDRFLQKTSAFTVGLCYHKLIYKKVPRESHDIPVKCLVSDKKITRLP